MDESRSIRHESSLLIEQPKGKTNAGLANWIFARSDVFQLRGPYDLRRIDQAKSRKSW